MTKNNLFLIFIAVITGFLFSGLIFLINSKPADNAIQILPAPTTSPIQVFISGSIKNPGIYGLPKGSRLSDLIDMAGGAISLDMDHINLAAKLYDGQHIHLGEITDQLENKNNNDFEKININEADVNELDALPGIGETRAKDIVEYRDTNGYFDKIEDILNVRGIGESTFNQIKELIAINQFQD